MDLILPVLGALVAGGLVGLEREFRGQPAGLRTHILVCLTSAFLMLMAVEQVSWMRGASDEIVRIDPVRMAHGVLTGVGFLCGGVIFRTGVTVHGLTTAASLWITSALGMLYGVGLWPLAVGATVLTLLTLAALRLIDEVIPQQATAWLAVRFRREGAPSGAELKAQLRGLKVRNSTFSHRLLDRGEMVEHSANVRAKSWKDIDAMMDALGKDPRVLEFELLPRKP